jgi:hypothetical protein
VTALSRYLFSVLREGDALYRGSVDSLEPILLVAPVGEYSAHESRPMAGMTLGLEDPAMRWTELRKAIARSWPCTPPGRELAHVDVGARGCAGDGPP